MIDAKPRVLLKRVGALSKHTRRMSSSGCSGSSYRMTGETGAVLVAQHRANGSG
jgi:hypothetical protein